MPGGEKGEVTMEGEMRSRYGGGNTAKWRNRMSNCCEVKLRARVEGGGSRWRPAALVPSRQRRTRPWTSAPNGPALKAKMRAPHRYDCERERVPASLPAHAHAIMRTHLRSSCPGGSSKERGRGSIAVGNLASRAREAVDPAAWEVRVDRARPGHPPSPLGNPFPMRDTHSGQSCSDRSLREAASSRRISGDSGSFI
eukprot:scaffold6454_cov113-Isochrysis_galbana.AAC.14